MIRIWERIKNRHYQSYYRANNYISVSPAAKGLFSWSMNLKKLGLNYKIGWGEVGGG